LFVVSARHVNQYFLANQYFHANQHFHAKLGNSSGTSSAIPGLLGHDRAGG